jgi:hypothetical protein
MGLLGCRGEWMGRRSDDLHCCLAGILFAQCPPDHILLPTPAPMMERSSARAR